MFIISITPNVYDALKMGFEDDNVLFVLLVGLDGTIAAIVMNLVYRRAIYVGKNKIWKTIYNVEGFTIVKGSAFSRFYILYIFNKGYVLLFGKMRFICTKSRDLLYLDVWNPISIALLDNYTYYMTFIDDAS